MIARLVSLVSLSAFTLLLSAIVAVPAHAASGGDSGFGWSWFNFILLVLVLGYFARKSLPELMLSRRATVKAEIEKATDLLAEAEARLAEWQGKVDALDREVEELRGDSIRIAESEKAHILEQAQKTAERIRNEGKAAVAREIENARTELRAEAANLAIEYAQEVLAQNINEGDRGRLLDGFIERLEQTSSTSGEARR